MAQKGLRIDLAPTPLLQEDLEAFQAHLQAVQAQIEIVQAGETGEGVPLAGATLDALQGQKQVAEDIIASIQAELDSRRPVATGAPLDFGGPGG